MLNRREMLWCGAAATLAGSVSEPRAQVVATATQGQRAISILSDGAFQMPLSMLARDVPVDAISAETRTMGPVTNVLNVTCFRQGDQVVVFDCGSGANFLPGTGKLATSLEAAGITPDSVTHVLFTHLHPDHFWGSLDDFDSPLFPNARWLADRREVAFCLMRRSMSGCPRTGRLSRQARSASSRRWARGWSSMTQARNGSQASPPSIRRDIRPAMSPSNSRMPKARSSYWATR